jgi:glucose/arabinose dehydrogenase
LAQSSLLKAVLVAAVCALAASSCGSGRGHAAATDGLVAIGAGLRGPSGLHATVYARGVTHVSAFAFDGRGRLWATASGATTHGGDGVYLVARPGTRAVKVVAGPRGPLGLVWIGSSLYVSSLGAVTRFSRLDGTHFDARETVLHGPVPDGENNNLVRAPNGRLLMGISSTCDHCVPPSRWAATIVSFRRDGSGLAVFARGIRAAYGLAFRPGTANLLATMNQRDDLGARTPGDWLALVRRGQDWGFPACYGQGGAACRGVPKPIAVLDKHAAAGGVAVLTSQLGGRFDGSALVAEWQTGKVRRVPLEQTADGYRGTAEAFLTGIANPLPVTTTAGGDVLVGDWSTGTIYRISASG